MSYHPENLIIWIETIETTLSGKSMCTQGRGIEIDPSVVFISDVAMSPVEKVSF